MSVTLLLSISAFQTSGKMYVIVNVISLYLTPSGSHSKHFQLEITDSSQVKRGTSMIAAMTPGSNPTVVITRKGERSCCALCRQQKARSDNISYFSHSRPAEPKQTKSPCCRTRVKFCVKDRVRMEQREPKGDSPSEGTEGRLRELTSKWFIDTQLPLIINNGLFPSWFMGFISRKDAENILREEELGCFLIRLSDKAIGYVLSYRGRDRCRHFVISQTEEGKFQVCGDTEGHDTMLDLIEYYKMRPIQPFGEYLTSSCFKDHNQDLYDTIQVNPKEKPSVVLRTAQANSIGDLQPSRHNRTEEEVPPLPRRSRHLDTSTFTDEERVLYAQLKKNRESPRGQHVSQDSLPGANPRKAERSAAKEESNGRSSPPSRPESIYSEINPLDTKSKSLPLLDSMSDSEQSYRLSVPPNTPPRLSPKPVRQASNCTAQSKSSHSLDVMTDNAVYHLATFDDGSSKEGQQNESLYAEVGIETPIINNDSTYELLPDHKEPVKSKHNTNTYDAVEDNRRKANRIIKNDKWKWLFPDSKRK